MAYTRSPSPNPSRPSNPSPKSQVNSRVLRQSGTFPSKHCITSAITQKNSSSKSASALPSPRAFLEHKENERDLNGSKPARTRSPAENPYKGIKGFMAPTISASSKIAAASPRKKILSEKNEVLQDSVKSPSVLVEGVKVEEILPKSEMDFESEDISDRNGSRMMDFSGSRGHSQSKGCYHPSSVLVEAVNLEEILPKSEMDFESEDISDRNRSRMMDFSGSRGHSQSKGCYHPSSVLVEAVNVEEILPKSVMDFESEDISDRNGSRMMDFSGSRGHSQSKGCYHPSSVLVEAVNVEEILPKSEMDSESEDISDRNRSRMMNFSGSRCHNQSTRSHHPYDPLTNFLSPRPQFLHYKPKPMIEQNHGFTEDSFYVGDGRRLEDSFSETEGSDVCSEYTEETEASPVKKGPEDEYVSTMLNSQEDLVPDETCVSEDLVPDETYVSEPKTRSETYKPRIYTRSFKKSKIIPFLLFSTIVFSCFPLADLPVFSPLMKYESFVGPHNQSFGIVEGVHPKYYLAFVSRNIQGLVSMLRQWLLDSIVVLSSSGHTSRDESDMMLFFNMTISPSIVRKKETIDGNPVNTMESVFEPDKMVRNAMVRDEIDNGEKLHFKLSDVNRDVARDEMVQEQEDSKYGKYEDLNSLTDPKLHFKLSDVNRDRARDEMVQELEDSKYGKYEDLNSLTDPVFEFETTNKKYQTKMIDVAISEEADGKGYPAGFEIAQELEEQILVDLKQENSHSSIDQVDSSTELVVASQIKEQKDDGGVDQQRTKKIMASAFANNNLILPVFGVLAMALVFLLMKQRHIHASSDKKHLSKKNRSVSGGRANCRDFNNESPSHNLTGLDEFVGDSDPIEMSSSLTSGFSVRHQRKKIASHELTPNYETLQRRESGVSSSSISYGSFTAFEKTSARKGEKDDEVMTPVRRSSRIRNQAISG